MCLYLVLKWPESRGEFVSALLKQGGLILFASFKELFTEVPQSLQAERLPWCFLQTWIFLCSFWMFFIVIYGLYPFVLMTVVDQLLGTSCLSIGPRHFPPDCCSPLATSQPDFPFLVCFVLLPLLQRSEFDPLSCPVLLIPFLSYYLNFLQQVRRLTSPGTFLCLFAAIW